MGGLSSPDDRGYSVAVYNSSEIYTLGMFRGTVDFDPGPGTASLAAVGSNSMFLQKLHKGISNDIAETATENAISIYPNPAGDIVTVVNITTPATVTVYDVTG